MSDPEYPATVLAEIDAASAAFAQQEQIPGLALGIVQDGRLVHTVTVGLADRERGRRVEAGTAFRIASMTKNMTALASPVVARRGKAAARLRRSTGTIPQFAAVKPATRDSGRLRCATCSRSTAGLRDRRSVGRPRAGHRARPNSTP